MASTRRLWAENLHAYVFVGEFVHVKETAGDCAELVVQKHNALRSLVVLLKEIVALLRDRLLALRGRPLLGALRGVR